MRLVELSWQAVVWLADDVECVDEQDEMVDELVLLRMEDEGDAGRPMSSKWLVVRCRLLEEPFLFLFRLE